MGEEPELPDRGSLCVLASPQSVKIPMDLADWYYSRTPWQGEDVSMQQIKERTQRNDEGYVNVAPQLGLSGQRGKSFPPFLFPEHKS